MFSIFNCAYPFSIQGRMSNVQDMFSNALCLLSAMTVIVIEKRVKKEEIA